MGSSTVDGNLTVTGDFTVQGTSLTIDSTTTSITDSMMELASGNTSSDLLDIGFYGNYDDGLGYAKKISMNCDLVIYKMGEKGSITFANNEEIQQGIFPVKPLKPTGAGDAFMGSLIGAILKNYDLQKAIEIGSAAAAIVVTKVGCAPAMPDLDEVLDFMKNNNINKGER